MYALGEQVANIDLFLNGEADIPAICVCVCVPVCMCVYLNLLGCGNREDNGSSSTASNNDQIGAQVSLPEPN